MLYNDDLWCHFYLQVRVDSDELNQELQKEIVLFRDKMRNGDANNGSVCVLEIAFVQFLYLSLDPWCMVEVDDINSYVSLFLLYLPLHNVMSRDT